MPTLRIDLPLHLRRLANIPGHELTLDVPTPITLRTVLDTLEQTYPQLRGTIRDHTTKERRPFLRFFVCEEDWSHHSPDTELPAAAGGVGRMCSFGESISMTPLQLGALVSAIANGGTLYYLQHPTSPDEIAAFEPHVKRTLDIAKFVPDMQEGMAGAVQYGTARSLHATFHDFPVFGKTGTCSDNGTRFGWFASFSSAPQGNLVTVFFLEGGRPTFGPRAAELTGEFYKNLWDRNYFANKGQQEARASTPSVPAAPAVDDEPDGQPADPTVHQ